MKKYFIFLLLVCFLFGFRHVDRRFYWGGGLFSGDLGSVLNDANFEELTTGTAYEISDFGLGAELLINGDMESATTEWVAYGTPTTCEVSTDQAHSGTKSWKFVSNSIADGIKTNGYARWSTIENCWYRFSLWVYPDDSTRIKIGVLDGATYTVYDEIIEDLVQDSWNEIIIYAKAENTGSSGYLAIRDGSGDTGTWYVDDISVKPVAQMTFTGGSELTSGELDDDSYYLIVSCQANYFYTGNLVGDRFKGSTATEQTINASNTVKLLHDFAEDDVITIGGATDGEGLGAELALDGDMETFDGGAPDNWTLINSATSTQEADPRTGSSGSYCAEITRGTGNICLLQVFTTVVGAWYEVTAWSRNVDASSGVRIIKYDSDYSNNVSAGSVTSTSWTDVGFTFQATDTSTLIAVVLFGSTGEKARVDDISVKEILPVQAIPYRIAGVDANGVVTLRDCDLSDMAANLSSGYASSVDFTNYTAGAGWMPYIEVDPTPINSNSEFGQWTYTAKTSGTTVSGHMYRIDAQSVIDFTTVGSADNVVGTEFLCTGVVALSAVDAVSEITPDDFTVTGLSATDYLVYDTTANTIQFVSDGGSFPRIAASIDADTNWYYEVGIDSLTSGELAFNNYGGAISYLRFGAVSAGHYQGYIKGGNVNNPALNAHGTTDLVCSYFRLFKVTETGAKCDGTQTGVSTLVSNEFATEKDGYNVNIDCTVSTGSVTPIVGSTYGDAISATEDDNNQDIEGTASGTAGVEASTAFTGVLTELTIKQYE